MEGYRCVRVWGLETGRGRLGMEGRRNGGCEWLQIKWTALKCRTLVQARCVQFCSKSDHMFQKLSYLLCKLCLSFVTITLSQAFLRFIVFSDSSTAYTMLSFSSMWRHGHSPKLTSSRALQYCTVGIPFWTSRKDSHKRVSSTEKPQLRVITHLPLHMCCGEVYGNIAREENGWLSRGLAVSL